MNSKTAAQALRSSNLTRISNGQLVPANEPGLHAEPSSDAIATVLSVVGKRNSIYVIFFDDGYELIDSFLTPEQLETLNREIGLAELLRTVGGVRNAQEKYPCIKRFTSSTYAIDKAAGYLRRTPKLVRAILFNKTEVNNWLVSWHQDKTVAVSKEFRAEGWGPWSEKDGVVHVQPPVEVLNSMVTFRIHLDASSEENGCLSVLPGSHKLGILTQQEIAERSSTFEPVLCKAPERFALVMRPHLLHASAKGTAPTQRRVLHIEYCDYELPSGVAWAKSG